MKAWECWQHACRNEGCERSLEGVTLFCCEVCPSAFCEHCLLPDAWERMTGTNLRLQRLGYEQPENVCYMLCSKDCEDFACSDVFLPPEGAAAEERTFDDILRFPRAGEGGEGGGEDGGAEGEDEEEEEEGGEGGAALFEKLRGGWRALLTKHEEATEERVSEVLVDCICKTHLLDGDTPLGIFSSDYWQPFAQEEDGIAPSTFRSVIAALVRRGHLRERRHAAKIYEAFGPFLERVKLRHARIVAALTQERDDNDSDGDSEESSAAEGAEGSEGSERGGEGEGAPAARPARAAAAPVDLSSDSDNSDSDSAADSASEGEADEDYRFAAQEDT